jgi:hypothetical protein
MSSFLPASFRPHRRPPHLQAAGCDRDPPFPALIFALFGNPSPSTSHRPFFVQCTFPKILLGWYCVLNFRSTSVSLAQPYPATLHCSGSAAYSVAVHRVRRSLRSCCSLLRTAERRERRLGIKQWPDPAAHDPTPASLTTLPCTRLRRAGEGLGLGSAQRCQWECSNAQVLLPAAAAGTLLRGT